MNIGDGNVDYETAMIGFVFTYL